MAIEKVNEPLNKLQMGDVILFHKKGINPGSLGIKLANFFNHGFGQRGWTHTAFYLGNDEVIEAYPQGIQQNKFSERYLQGNYGLLFLRHKSASAEKLKKAAEFCISEKGEPYDTSALLYFIFFNFIPQQFHFLLNIHNFSDHFNEDKKYFCSELVARSYEESGLCCFERKSYKIMPSDFNNPLLFDEIARIDLPKENKLIAGFVYAGYLAASIIAMLLGVVIVLLPGFLIIGILILAGFSTAPKKDGLEVKPR